MLKNSNNFIIIIASVILLCACDKEIEQNKHIPAHINALNSLFIYDPGIDPIDTVELSKVTVFESNEEVLIGGYIGEIAVDDRDRVYIIGSGPSDVGIYIFASDGNYLTKISKYGRGPGEFESISSIDIYKDHLYAFDARIQKFSVFSLSDFTHLYDEFVDKEKVKKEGEFTSLMRGKRLFVTGSGELIMHFQVNNLYDINKYPQIRLYKINDKGMVDRKQLIELKKYQYYMDKPEQGSDGTNYPFTAPFTRSSIYVIKKDGTIYSSWTEDFLIKKYNQNGIYNAAFYYPVRKSLLSLPEVEISNWKKREIKKYEVPDTWPAIYTMEIDEENRLWVSTITESDSTFTWWVVGEEGKVLATFTKPGKRSKISVTTKPIYKIKNGYFYELERDIRNGIDRIVKYKIEFIKR